MAWASNALPLSEQVKLAVQIRPTVPEVAGNAPLVCQMVDMILDSTRVPLLSWRCWWSISWRCWWSISWRWSVWATCWWWTAWPAFTRAFAAWTTRASRSAWATAHWQLFTSVTGRFDLFRIKFTVFIGVVFIKHRFALGFHLGFEGSALGFVEFAVAVGIVLFEHFRFALIGLGLHFSAHGSFLVGGKFTVAILVEFSDDGRRQFALWTLRGGWCILSCSKAASPDQSTQSDQFGGFHSSFYFKLGRQFGHLIRSSNHGFSKRLRSFG